MSSEHPGRSGAAWLRPASLGNPGRASAPGESRPQPFGGGGCKKYLIQDAPSRRQGMKLLFHSEIYIILYRSFCLFPSWNRAGEGLELWDHCGRQSPSPPSKHPPLALGLQACRIFRAECCMQITTALCCREAPQLLAGCSRLRCHGAALSAALPAAPGLGSGAVFPITK